MVSKETIRSLLKTRSDIVVFYKSYKDSNYLCSRTYCFDVNSYGIQKWYSIGNNPDILTLEEGIIQAKLRFPEAKCFHKKYPDHDTVGFYDTMGFFLHSAVGATFDDLSVFLERCVEV